MVVLGREIRGEIARFARNRNEALGQLILRRRPGNRLDTNLGSVGQSGISGQFDHPIFNGAREAHDSYDDTGGPPAVQRTSPVVR